MKRIYAPFAYGDDPIRDRFWDSTVPPPPDLPPLQGDHVTEVAIIGGGYTGLSAALRLAEAGVDSMVLDAKPPGWGASGRNGGLVSTGSAKLGDDAIRRRYGAGEAQAFFDAERAAVDGVADLIARHDLQVDRQSRGYTYVAHRPDAVDELHAYGQSYRTRYGLDYEYIPPEAMADHGLVSPDFHAAVHLPLGFALNPMKFLRGLLGAAQRAGVMLSYDTPVAQVGWDGAHVLSTPRGRVRARHLLVASNGYSSEDLPGAMAARYLPVQSNILVTRPLSADEIAAQGWTSDQMVVDTRNLLHYLRKLPDNRVLLGLRGSAQAGARSHAATQARARADFDRMFPAWRQVEMTHFWSGLICMTRALVPFAGPLPGMERAWAAFGYHGSGVSMAPYCGALLADLVLGRREMPHPDFMKTAARFELGGWRRAVLRPVFAWYGWQDR
ncbi:MAG: FAD-binding oxidoreductase [Marinibacterium sp.]|nr:FAD-binding oxidoreductase [Marinibacterium sp.]